MKNNRLAFRPQGGITHSVPGAEPPGEGCVHTEHGHYSKQRQTWVVSGTAIVLQQMANQQAAERVFGPPRFMRWNPKLGGPTFWHLWATLEEEELSWATH